MDYLYFSPNEFHGLRDESPQFLKSSQYIERVAEFNGRSPRPPILLCLCSSPLRFASNSVPCSDFLLGQFHQVPHQFVQIERHDRPRPCHLQRLPQTFLRFVEFVPIAFECPDHPFGLTPLAAYLIPDCLGNRPGPLPSGLNPNIFDALQSQFLARQGRIAPPVVDEQLRCRFLTKYLPVA